MSARTMFEKLWSAHVIAEEGDNNVLLYIDRLLLFETSGAIFKELASKGHTFRRPDLAFATVDHLVSTTPGVATTNKEFVNLIETVEQKTSEYGIKYFGLNDDRRGIVHVIGPEQGISLPGTTIVCTDSHTSTHGAFGSLAFGIGLTELLHVMATQTVWQKKPKTMRIRIRESLGFGVTAKDLIMFIIEKIGVSAGVGYAIEFSGPTIASMSMTERMTICNMSIEAGAKMGFVAPDEKTFSFLKDRPFSPKGKLWNLAIASWTNLKSDVGAIFDREIEINASEVVPSVTWGTSLRDTIPITGVIPDPQKITDPALKKSISNAIIYMGLQPGVPIIGTKIDRVFIGSCTNSRIEDLRAVAEIVKGKRALVPSWIVPGSGLVKKQAENEGLDQVFIESGFSWHEPGCSMCNGRNGETANEGERIASTTNRNFEGRQGRGVRTHLMSPIMAAAAALTGKIVDVRSFGEKE